MSSQRELAMQLAVKYCEAHPNEDLVAVATQIYQFLMKDINANAK